MDSRTRARLLKLCLSMMHLVQGHHCVLPKDKPYEDILREGIDAAMKLGMKEIKKDNMRACKRPRTLREIYGDPETKPSNLDRPLPRDCGLVGKPENKWQPGRPDYKWQPQPPKYKWLAPEHDWQHEPSDFFSGIEMSVPVGDRS